METAVATEAAAGSQAAAGTEASAETEVPTMVVPGAPLISLHWNGTAPGSEATVATDAPAATPDMAVARANTIPEFGIERKIKVRNSGTWYAGAARP